MTGDHLPLASYRGFWFWTPGNSVIPIQANHITNKLCVASHMSREWLNWHPMQLSVRNKVSK